MSALAIFGICVAITIVFLIVFVSILGSGSIMLLVILPTLIAEMLTGQRGSFNPNGATRRAPMFEPVMFLFLIVQVLILAGILFGFYCLVFGWPTTVVAAAAPAAPLDSLQVYRLLIINTVLWGIAGFFIAMMTFNMIRFREHVKKMPPYSIILNYVLPLVCYPLAFVFLAASRNYLTHYGEANVTVSAVAKACAVLYIGYLIFSSGQLVYVYRSVLRGSAAQLGFQYWFSILTSSFYKVLFVYFVVRIFTHS